MINFRTRSDNSLLYSTITIKKMIEHVKKTGEKTAVLIDKHVMFGVLDFYKQCENNNIKPIIGIETNLHFSLDIKEKYIQYHSVIFIAKNNNGYKNLMKISSTANGIGFFKEPRINFKHLKEMIDDIIVIIPSDSSLLESDSLNDFKSICKELYVGLSFYDEYSGDIPTVCAQEFLFLENEMEAREILRLIGEENPSQFIPNLCKKGEEHKLVSDNRLLEIFSKETINNSYKLISKIDLYIKLGEATPPGFIDTHILSKKYNITNSDDEVFSFLCRKKLNERLQYIDKSLHQKYFDRLEFEIGIINKMKFPGYMLIVWDFVKEAKKLGIAVGPGRGSAAGSLVAYALEITDIDPIKYGLLFERFLNPDRVSMPDIDIDFMQERRQEIIQYVISKYNFDNVSQIATFSTLLPKGVIKDVAKVLGFNYSSIDKITKDIPGTAKNLKEAMDAAPEAFEALNNLDPSGSLLNYCFQLEGIQRNMGIHAAGVAISDNKIYEKTPTIQSQNDGMVVTQYSLNYLEDVDLIKFDFLGLKTLDVISNSLKAINKNHNLQLTTYDIDVDDPFIYETLTQGNTTGMFQIESPGMKSLNKRLKPDGFEELVAILALYRPGPINSGMLDDFIDRKHGRKEIVYKFPSLEPVLKNTFGVPVYQEQIMSMVQVIGGFSLAESDIIRRAMGKKKPEVMKKYREEFVKGATKQGYPAADAEETFDLITGFAEYGFNKSHSAAYAMITAQTAWLKIHYPSEFMASLLTSIHDEHDKLKIYIKHCIDDLNIEIKQPNINSTALGFVANEDGSITYGIDMIKGVGRDIAEHIIHSRLIYGKPFYSLSDFLNNINVSLLKKDTFEFLAASGAFDCFTISRNRLFNNSTNILKQASIIHGLHKEFNLSLFSENFNLIKKYINVPKSDSQFEEFNNEVRVLSYPLGTSNPFSNIEVYREIEDDGHVLHIDTLIKVSKITHKISKKNKPFLLVQAIDSEREYEGVFFSNKINEIFTDDYKDKIFDAKIQIKDNDGRESVFFSHIKDTFQTFESKDTQEIVFLIVENISFSDEIIESYYSEQELYAGGKKIVLLYKENSKWSFKILDIFVNDLFFEKYKDLSPWLSYNEIRKKLFSFL